MVAEESSVTAAVDAVGLSVTVFGTVLLFVIIGEGEDVMFAVGTAQQRPRRVSPQSAHQVD